MVLIPMLSGLMNFLKM
nr:unnamed protein product [Callosobruchus analis]